MSSETAYVFILSDTFHIYPSLDIFAHDLYDLQSVVSKRHAVNQKTKANNIQK